MNKRIIVIEGVGEVELRKSHKARRMILSIPNDAIPRVTIPKNLPFIVAKQFALQHTQWLKEHSTNQSVQELIKNGMRVGNSHIINFKPGSKLNSRVTNSIITVNIPSNLQISDLDVQKEAKSASTRAIRRQAEQLLPSRTYQLAQKYGFSFKEVRVKSLKTRWGSCSNQKIINLNIWLVQLSGNLIDYVITHELAHLKHPHHQSAFWDELSKMTPAYKELRKELKRHHPKLLIQA